MDEDTLIWAGAALIAGYFVYNEVKNGLFGKPVTDKEVQNMAINAGYESHPSTFHPGSTMILDKDGDTWTTYEINADIINNMSGWQKTLFKMGADLDWIF